MTDELTGRQKRILEMLAEGKTGFQAAIELNMPAPEVSRNLKWARKKLQAATNVEAAVKWDRLRRG